MKTMSALLWSMLVKKHNSDLHTDELRGGDVFINDVHCSVTRALGQDECGHGLGEDLPGLPCL
jgi:hypothetical protein